MAPSVTPSSPTHTRPEPMWSPLLSSQQVSNTLVYSAPALSLLGPSQQLKWRQRGWGAEVGPREAECAVTGTLRGLGEGRCRPREQHGPGLAARGAGYACRARGLRRRGQGTVGWGWGAGGPGRLPVSPALTPFPIPPHPSYSSHTSHC